MIALHAAVEAALGKLGFRKEHRRFEPHLTLGRVRSGGPAVASSVNCSASRPIFRPARATSASWWSSPAN